MMNRSDPVASRDETDHQTMTISTFASQHNERDYSSTMDTPLQWQGELVPSSSKMRSEGASKTRPNNIRVVARIRPMFDTEEMKGCQVGIHPLESSTGFFDDENSIKFTPSNRPLHKGKRLFSRFTPLRNALTPSRKGRNLKTPSQSDEAILSEATPLVNNMSRNSATDSPPISPTTSRQTRSPLHFPKSLIAESTIQRKHFDLDAVFGPDISQKDVYEVSVGDTVRQNILQGYNTTIFAYGQTASGKTYTMSGPQESLSFSQGSICVSESDGVIPRAIQDLFEAKQQYAASKEVKITLTYLEIYNDELRDLLVEGNKGAECLKLRDHGDEEGVVVKGMVTVQVEYIEQVKQLIHKAMIRRTTGSTRMNERSSRSHSICTLTVTIQPKLSGKASNTSPTSEDVTTAKLTLVDLAGSERIKETGVAGLQKQESININKDLFVLGKVVSALSEQSKRGKSKIHVPYRDSKLTRLLRDSLGGK